MRGICSLASTKHVLWEYLYCAQWPFCGVLNDRLQRILQRASPARASTMTANGPLVSLNQMLNRITPTDCGGNPRSPLQCAHGWAVDKIQHQQAVEQLGLGILAVGVGKGQWKAVSDAWRAQLTDTAPGNGRDFLHDAAISRLPSCPGTPAAGLCFSA